MPRKTLLWYADTACRLIGFNEAAARCRGKQTSGGWKEVATPTLQ